MELEKIKITDITPAGYNPRKINENDYLKLKNSLNTFGMVDPIVINLKNNHIIGGHQRYDVLLDEYMEDGFDDTELNMLRLGNVGWVFKDTDMDIKDDTHEKALNLALNKISGEFDIPKLEELLIDLSETGLDLDLTGFDDLEVNDIINVFDSDIPDDELDNGLEDNFDEDYLFDETVQQKHTFYLIPGETWNFGNHKLIVGETNEDDRFRVTIDNTDLILTFEKVEGSDETPLEDFKRENENNDGLVPEGRR